MSEGLEQSFDLCDGAIIAICTWAGVGEPVTDGAVLTADEGGGEGALR